MNGTNDDVAIEPLGQGRGRGRGRGAGVPVLPVGLWDELSGNSDKKSSGIDKMNNEIEVNKVAPDAIVNSTKFADADEGITPFGFGSRGRGRGRGRGAGRMGGRGGRGRGPEKDVKGPDWDCTLCGNTNWSWRNNCNRCQTVKPVTLQVNIYPYHFSMNNK